MFKLATLALFLEGALLAAAGISQKDFTGIGYIQVVNSSDWRKVNLATDTVGCLDANGKFLNPTSDSECGVFSRLADYPWTLSSPTGNCTFEDETQEKNRDSYYGKNDNAWNCVPKYEAIIYDELYTIDGFPHVFLCFGDIACYYDAKRIPDPGEKTSLWQFRWGSQQLGITPGHVMLQLVWHKLGELPKREGAEDIPSPRLTLEGGLQIPLLGKQIKS